MSTDFIWIIMCMYVYVNIFQMKNTTGELHGIWQSGHGKKENFYTLRVKIIDLYNY